MSQEGFAAIMNELRDRSAIACMNAPMPPDPPKGNQFRKFEIGEIVYSTGVGPLKKDIAIVVTGNYEDHGYWYYEGYAGAHREKDLTATPPTGVKREYKVLVVGKIDKPVRIVADSHADAIDKVRAQGKQPVAAI